MREQVVRGRRKAQRVWEGKTVAGKMANEAGAHRRSGDCPRVGAISGPEFGDTAVCVCREKAGRV